MTLKVLVVDDSPVIRAVTKIYLQRFPLDVVEAGNVDPAMDVLRSQAVDLVIADINMPGTSGIDFLKRVRSELPRRVPVILITSDGSQGVRSRATEAGADAFLRKPVSSAGLIEAVTRLLKIPSDPPSPIARREGVP